jgi:hypothetical protein
MQNLPNTSPEISWQENCAIVAKLAPPETLPEQKKKSALIAK